MFSRKEKKKKSKQEKKEPVPPASYPVSFFDHVPVNKIYAEDGHFPTDQIHGASIMETKKATNVDKNGHKENISKFSTPASMPQSTYDHVAVNKVPGEGGYFPTGQKHDMSNVKPEKATNIENKTDDTSIIKESTPTAPILSSTVDDIHINGLPEKIGNIPKSQKDEMSTMEPKTAINIENKTDKTSITTGCVPTPLILSSIVDGILINSTPDENAYIPKGENDEKSTMKPNGVNAMESICDKTPSIKEFAPPTAPILSSTVDDIQNKDTLEDNDYNPTGQKDEKSDMKPNIPNNQENIFDETSNIKESAPSAPILSSTIDDIPVYQIPDEDGYFPTGLKDEILVCCNSTKLYQLNPEHNNVDNTSGKVLAEGPMILRDPSPGTPDQVALVGECEGILFYVKNDDAIVKISNDEFVLFLPKECIGISLDPKTEEHIKLHIEGLFAYRTVFSEDLKKDEKITEDESVGKEGPSDKISQSMIGMSKWLAEKIVKGSEKGARKIEKYGENKRSNITEVKETHISPTAMKTAKVTKKVAKTTNKVATKVSSSISGAIGSALSKAVTPKSTDSTKKQKARSILLASTISVCEIMDGLGEGYDNLSTCLKKEGTAFVEAKYGVEAGELARHTAGATLHFGKALLTTRQVLNTKKVLKSGVKEAAKQTLKKTNENTTKSIESSQAKS